MFRLDRVLQWKERVERAALSERMVLENREAELRRALAASRRSRAAAPEPAETSTVEDLMAWSQWAEGLRRNEFRLQQRMNALQPELEEKRQAHLEARREVEGLRKLRERWERARKKRLEKRNQEATDEVAARRFLPGSGRTFRDGPDAEAGNREANAPKDVFPRSDAQNQGTGT
ncbi:MAG: hypothetical protein HKN12_05700 [Gemmatimonadetes bacterium]|nr:hypothetical protein [Gemmatimonadota bacterium]